MVFPKKVAAIDIGTNSFHMVIAEIDIKGNIKLISRDKEYVRLGASATDMKLISDDALKRAIVTLKAFSKIAQNENAEVLAIATSAVREADNKKAFVELVKKETDIDIEVVSGSEEARLIYNGAIHALPVHDKKVILMDIGGGSTEIVYGVGNEIKFSKSVKLGTVRLLKKFFDKDKITSEDIKSCQKFIDGEWSNILAKVETFDFDEVVFTSGTLENLIIMAHISDQGLSPSNYNGLEVSGESLTKVISMIKQAKNTEKISKIEGVESKRVDIILGGSLIAEYFINRVKPNSVRFSSYALREGILYDFISKEISRVNDNRFSNLRINTLINLIKKYNIDESHSLHIWKLSKKIFDALEEEFELTSHDSEMLEAASYLHDAGFFISADSHHKHSYYLIKNSEMPGFTSDEAEIIANIARYHRKSMPKQKHDNFTQIRDSYKPKIWILGGILRIAEAIERREASFINDLKIDNNKKQLIIKLISNDNSYPELEIWGAKRRKEMLEKAIQKKIKILF